MLSSGVYCTVCVCVRVAGSASGIYCTVCVCTYCRFGIKLPRYQQIVNALTWMSHSQTLRRVSREYVIDLYLRPPVSRFRLMDFHLMDRIVRDANRLHSFFALSQSKGLLINLRL